MSFPHRRLLSGVSAAWLIVGLALPSFVGATGPTPAAEPADPPSARVLGHEAARHLLSRAWFGGSPSEIARFADLTREEAIDTLLDSLRSDPSTPPPAWADTDPEIVRSPSPQVREEIQQQKRAQSQELKEWWYRELVTTESPFTERLTLFWHNHFTSSLLKVRRPRFLYRQNLLLRRHAAGNYRDLTVEVARDAAMSKYLDGNSNRRRAPNENFARELLELFTLGEGHYTETDIKEAARAFTGRHFHIVTGEYVFSRRRHDRGEKTFLGHTGKFDGDAIMRIIFDQPEAGRIVVEKLWREFVSETPDPAEVTRLHARFRAADFEMRPLLRALFLSDAFWAEENRGRLVKSPVDLVVGTVRVLERPPQDYAMLVRVGRVLRQDLFDPPNVKGWPGHTDWIDSSTLLVREQILRSLVSRMSRAREMGEVGGEGMQGASVFDWYERLGTTDAERRALAETVLLPLEPVATPPERRLRRNPSPLRVLSTLLLDPTYQLK